MGGRKSRASFPPKRPRCLQSLPRRHRGGGGGAFFPPPLLFPFAQEEKSSINLARRWREGGGKRKGNPKGGFARHWSAWEDGGGGFSACLWVSPTEKSHPAVVLYMHLGEKKRGEDGFRARTEEEEEEILTRHSAPSSFSKSEEEEEARDRHTHHAYM